MSYKAKVKPPRLNGEKVGVYSTRSPHRPNAIGLTLAKLDSITGQDTLHRCQDTLLLTVKMTLFVNSSFLLYFITWR